MSVKDVSPTIVDREKSGWNTTKVSREDSPLYIVQEKVDGSLSVVSQERIDCQP